VVGGPGFGAVQAQPGAFAGGVGDHVGQGPQPHAGPAGDREAPRGKQRAQLMDRAGDGGAVDLVQHGHGVVGQLQSQDDEGGQQPVAEDQPVVGAGAGAAPPRVAAALPQGTLVGGGPRVGQLDGQLGEVLPGQPGAARMGEGRTGPWWSRHPRMITRAACLMLARRCS
jgi:hypothetical protein